MAPGSLAIANPHQFRLTIIWILSAVLVLRGGERVATVVGIRRVVSTPDREPRRPSNAYALCLVRWMDGLEVA